MSDRQHIKLRARRRGSPWTSEVRPASVICKQGVSVVRLGQLNIFRVVQFFLNPSTFYFVRDEYLGGKDVVVLIFETWGTCGLVNPNLGELVAPSLAQPVWTVPCAVSH